MKKQTFSTLAFSAFSLLFSNALSAQTWVGSSGSLYPNPISTRVGIGIVPPAATTDQFTVKGELGFSPWAFSYGTIYGRSSDRGIALFANSNNSDGSSILLNANGLGNNTKGGIQYVGSSTSTSDIAHQFISISSGGGWDAIVNMRKDGNVGIGVNGANITNKLTVNMNLGFYNPTNNTYSSINGNSLDRGLTLFANTNYNSGSSILLNANNLPNDKKGGIEYVASATTTSDIAHSFVSISGSGNWDRIMSLRKDGNVGIGVDGANITNKLTVNMNLGFYNPTNNTYSSINGNSLDRGLTLFANTNYNGGSSILLNANNLPNDKKGGIEYVASATTTSDIAHSFVSISGSGSWDRIMSLRKDGIVVVGNAPIPNSNYKLIVEKGILTERVRVAVQNTADWSDYVFADNYELKPLNEVEEFIKENKHLPEIPSAQDVVNEGIDMAKMDAKLLQKIEELTLYVINLQKQIQQQQKRIDVQSEELRSVKHSQ